MRLIAAKPTESLAMILAGLAAEESWKRAVAADCVVALKTPEEIQTIAAMVANLPVPGRIAALCESERSSRSCRARSGAAVIESD